MNPLTGPESRQNLLWLSVSLGFLALLWLLTPVLTPFVAAFIIGYVLNPGVDWLHGRGLPRVLAVLLAMLLVTQLLVERLEQLGLHGDGNGLLGHGIPATL